MSLSGYRLRLPSDAEHAALAEINRRECYELRLLAAQRACTRPIRP